MKRFVGPFVLAPLVTLVLAACVSHPAAPPSGRLGTSSLDTIEPRIMGAFAGEAQTLNGAGGTFPAPLYQRWFDEFAHLTGVEVNYQAIGSGGGIQGVQNQTIDFGASDAPMTDEQLRAARGGPVFHIPTALGAIVPTYNLPKGTARLKFTGDTLAGIYLGDIARWNDPKLVSDNPSLAQIDQDIVVIHRSDGSGTTFGWTDYLSTVSPVWLTRVGRGTSVDWPVGLGGSGNTGVAVEVQQNPYSIGYVELIYALQNNLDIGLVRNRDGNFVEGSLESVVAAASFAASQTPADLRFSMVDAPGPQSYPISSATWLLVYRNQTDPARAVALTRMLWWATHDAQSFNADLAYATVPDAITRVSERFINQITVNGAQAFPGS
jgi:phosphate transport system substrate-binding protein